LRYGMPPDATRNPLILLEWVGSGDQRSIQPSYGRAVGILQISWRNAQSKNST
jgi:hypothetical protein